MSEDVSETEPEVNPVSTEDAQDFGVPAEPGVEPEAETPKRKPRKPSAPAAANAVVSGAERDTVTLSRLVPVVQAKTRKSLSVHHLQRRLAELGYSDAHADRDGAWGSLTDSAVRAWQKDSGYEADGTLTFDQAEALFEGDPNVEVSPL